VREETNPMSPGKGMGGKREGNKGEKRTNFARFLGGYTERVVTLHKRELRMSG